MEVRGGAAPKGGSRDPGTAAGPPASRLAGVDALEAPPHREEGRGGTRPSLSQRGRKCEARRRATAEKGDACGLACIDGETVRGAQGLFARRSHRRSIVSAPWLRNLAPLGAEARGSLAGHGAPRRLETQMSPADLL
ncbi:hypothetical protein TGPRC2_274000B [Toxoplasma gondii TgCatPRC2]|uniref:Uncharacterized protein n=1 Tax=Toxoplasma gondii TgCatPRC2 TaxID=1130821 RepID=A0A151HPV9_TOXGO|nr:hypothetical protein TGPRC2_274000B [Toxoplasma gondii TgCatPRC2]